MVSASARFYEDFQVTPKDTIGNLLYRLGNGQWAIPQLRSLLETSVREGRVFEDFVVEHDFESIGHKLMSLSGRLIARGEQQPPMVLMQMEDITDKSQYGDNRQTR